MAKKAKESWGAEQVVSLLQKKHFTEPAHAVLREVRNGTGYSRQDRSADALVVSLWPSRGIWFAGLEVKVSRGDWQRELKDPEKSAEIQKWCDYWWIAAPEGVVLEGEVPEAWGWVEVSKSAVNVRKPAPKLETLPLSSKFVAAILRRQCATAGEMRASIRRELEAELSYETTPDEEQLKQKLGLETRAREQMKMELSEYKKRVREYADASGVDIMSSYSTRNSAKTMELAERLLGTGFGRMLSGLASELVDTAELIRAAQAEATLGPVHVPAAESVANDPEAAE